VKPHNLEEFAQELRRKGDFREVEFADEIVALLDIEAEVAEPYSELCVDIAHYAKDFSQRDDPAKALEWIGDRSNLLAEIEEQLSEAGLDVGANGLPINAADAVKDLIAALPEPMEYDL
jgi:hypothetical protein